ncbi:cell surface protein, partial [Streptococcus agalactiae]|nr:cell surface protein [Streptococcus agalactiae]
DISGFRQVYNEEYKKNQDGTFQKLKEEAFKLSDGEITELMRSFSSKPEYYTPIVTSADTSNNEILSKIQQQFETILTKENSIVNGTIEDPMGDKINLQLGNGQILQPSDYTLQGNDGSVMKDGIATGGPNNDGGILKGVKLEYIGNKLYVRGLNLGEGQKVTLTYDVKLDDSFISNKFYDTNGRTTLNPKSEDPNTLRDFPIPKIRDVREYPTITIK